jgi:glucosamine-6-phosphate deaminase
VVQLAEASRRQQVGEGHFESLDDVPTSAISLTIPALLAAPDIFIVVPEDRKAVAVAAALRGPVEPHMPASILQRTPGALVVLDEASARLLS